MSAVSLASASFASPRRNHPSRKANHSMSLRDSSGSAAILGIIVACLVVSCVITIVTGTWTHWIFTLAGIVAGLCAAASINR